LPVHCCVGRFLMELMQSLMGTKTFFDLLNFVINVMKYNAVYLKEDAVAGIIKYVKKRVVVESVAGNHVYLFILAICVKVFSVGCWGCK